MTYGYIVADFDYRFLVQGMQYAAVLYVYTVADTDGIDIATQYSVEPNTAIVADDYIANDGCIIGEIAILADNGIKASDRFDKCHGRYRLRGAVASFSHACSSVFK
jgi:hypothetical protein